MPQPLDLTKPPRGPRFGLLTVVALAPRDEWPRDVRGRPLRSWLCRCDCGGRPPRPVRTASLTGGNTTSCGCTREGAGAERWPEGRRPPCLVCGKQHFAFGLCKLHHARWQRRGRPPVGRWAELARDGRENVCVVCGEPFGGYKQRACRRKECRRELARRDTRDLRARAELARLARSAAELERRLDRAP